MLAMFFIPLVTFMLSRMLQFIFWFKCTNLEKIPCFIVQFFMFIAVLQLFSFYSCFHFYSCLTCFIVAVSQGVLLLNVHRVCLRFFPYFVSSAACSLILHLLPLNR